MKIVDGKYVSAKVFTDNVEDYAMAQIQMICDNQTAAGSTVRIMPDVHPGKVGPIGLTMSVSDAVLPGLVGIDIGCGVSVVKLKAKHLEFQKLDTVIRERIPSGFRVRSRPHHFSEDFPFEELRCYKHINLEKTMRSMGSLGGGNHFIEVDQSEDSTLYTTGAYDMFARVSNIDMNSRIVGFGLRNIDHNTVWEPAMLTIMQFLTMRIDENQKSKKALRLIVDEAQVMCEKETTADQLLYAVETYRKVGAIVTLVAQNLTHVLEHPRMRDMFSNCPYKVFLDQGGIDAVNLAQIQELSTAEARVLEEQRVGRGILVWGGRVFIFDSVMDKDNPLYDYFNTNYHEIAANERMKSFVDEDGSAITTKLYDKSKNFISENDSQDADEDGKADDGRNAEEGWKADAGGNADDSGKAEG